MLQVIVCLMELVNCTPRNDLTNRFLFVNAGEALEGTVVKTLHAEHWIAALMENAKLIKGIDPLIVGEFHDIPIISISNNQDIYQNKCFI